MRAIVLAAAAGMLSVSAACFALVCGLVPSALVDPGQYVRTQSGQVRCLVMVNDQGHGGGPAVACEHGPGFPQAPMGQYGNHLDLAVIHASGAFNWDDGNIGGGGAPQNDLVLDYGQTYHLQNWTILPNSDGTRFTNDATGHGMFVSVDNVSSF
ncbi:hypothetical protein [Mycobacterium colombiense]|nr:hypothetical protein [Mycobacterium colombiense]